MIKHFDRRHLLKRLGCLTFSPLASVLAMDASQTTTDTDTVRTDLLAVLEYGVPLQIECRDMFDTLALCGSSPRAVSMSLNAAQLQQGIVPALAASIRDLMLDATHSVDAAVVVIKGSKHELTLSRCKAVFRATTLAFETENDQLPQMLFGIALDESLQHDLRLTVVVG